MIVSTGFSGLGMAIKLKEAGIDDFVLIEKADSLAGTWRNTYPGCACDVPSHMYSFSFEPNPEWSEMYAPQEEIRDYLERCADKYDIRRHIVFGTRAMSATWDAETALWRCVGEGPDGREERTARFVVSGIGGLHVPAEPAFPGIEKFDGDVFHSATWNHEVDLRGKRVAVVGTGASAIQFVPEIAREVGRLDLYQRTAPWVLPKLDRHIPRFDPQALPALPGAPARLPPGDLLVPRAGDPARRAVEALRPAVRVDGPAQPRAAGEQPREAPKADAELRVRLQAHPDVERFLPARSTVRMRASSPRASPRSAPSRSSAATGSSARPT